MNEAAGVVVVRDGSECSAVASRLRQLLNEAGLSPSRWQNAEMLRPLTPWAAMMARHS